MKKIYYRLTLLSLLTFLTKTFDTIFYGELTLPNKPTFNALSTIRNQNLPTSCGASWAFAIASSMSDQFNARKHVEYAQVVLSPKMLLTCGANDHKTCDYAHEFDSSAMEETFVNLINFGVSDETCANWNGEIPETCDNKSRCMTCHSDTDSPNDQYCVSNNYRTYKLKSFERATKTNLNDSTDLLTTKKSVIESLHKYGPVICQVKHSKSIFQHRISGIDIYPESLTNPVDYSTWASIVGIIDSPKNTPSTEDVDHLWVVRLSFGDSVGRYGYVYLSADDNENPLGVLDNCYSIEVDLKIEITPNGEKTETFLRRQEPIESFDIDKSRFAFETATYSADKGDDKNDEIKPINWPNHDGRNYLTWIKNQLNPYFCGSCWAQAATSVLNDRLNISQIRNKKQYFPRHVFSVQALLNCIAGGTCLGGDSSLAWQRSKTWKIPTETCCVYTSVNPENFSCSGKSVCSNASRDQSWALEKYNGVKVIEWEMVRGKDKMKKALQDGPIMCSFENSDSFGKYKADPNKINI